VAAPFEPRVSVFALLLLVIALSTTTRLPPGTRTRPRLLLSLGLCLSLIGLGRFAMSGALPGIVSARRNSTNTRAVSLLREVLVAEDALRRRGDLDHDGDGVGSAARLHELTGARSARTGTPLPYPPLAPSLRPSVATRSGPAAERDDLLLLLCVPAAPSGFTAMPEAEVDEEAAERRFVAYVWPAREGGLLTAAYAIDQDERIFESENLRADGSLRLVSALSAPSCDDLETAPPSTYRPWKGKMARPVLPGDRPRSAGAPALPRLPTPTKAVLEERP